MGVARDSEALGEDVVIARVIKARGIRGEVACEMETDFPERFGEMERVTLRMPDGSRLPLDIEQHWFHGGRVILKFKGYDERTAAEALIGGRLVVPSAQSMPLARDQYYEYDIVGSEVLTIDGEDLGSVASILRTGGTDLLVVQDEMGRELLIPFVEGICREVDLDAGRIKVDPPAGLLELSR
ncbi:MAG TPA: ribosome maturation factor RimM [Blastocatellia bacterium]|nr:ribosome maturation factor RimM [Blastocatellia bacterium]